MLAKNTGQQAEQLALAYLTKQGLTMVTQNYHSRRGEIDLIMEDKEILVFVEVRYRKSAKYGSALESVNGQKQARIIRTAQQYLQQYPSNHSAYRFDVVALNPNENTTDINWVKDAFQLT